MLQDLVDFGARVNRNLEGQIKYLLNIENSLAAWFPAAPKDQSPSLTTEISPSLQKKIARKQKLDNFERALPAANWYLDSDPTKDGTTKYALSNLNDLSFNMFQQKTKKHSHKARKLYEEKMGEDTVKQKKDNYGIDFGMCRGHISEKEKEQGTVLNEKTNETLQQRLCMVLRLMVTDWKLSDDDPESFEEIWHGNHIKTALLDDIRCVNYDVTKKDEEKDLLSGKKDDKSYVFKKFKDTEKNRKKAAGEKCLDKSDEGYLGMKNFLENKMEFTAADYDANMKKCKNNEGYGKGGDTVDSNCTFWHKVLTNVKFLYNECFHENGREILSTDECKPKRAIRRDRVLSAQSFAGESVSLVLDQGMAQFDKTFKNMKKYSIVPKYGMNAEKLFKKLRTLVKTKLIEKKLNDEGKKIKTIGFYSRVDYDIADYLEDGENDESLTGLTPLGFTREEILGRKDVHEMISQVNNDDIEEIDGLDEISGVRGLQKTSAKAWVVGMGWGVVVALFFN